MVVGMALTEEERVRFLAEPHVAALSVVGRPDRAPLTVPIWYQYTPGGEAWILTEAGSMKAQRIEAAGRFTLMVDRLSPTVRYVTAEGPVTRTVPMTEDKIWEIARRYLPEESASAYVKMSLADHGEQVVIYMRPEHWLSSDLGGY
jgi:hypothetical protein